MDFYFRSQQPRYSNRHFFPAFPLVPLLRIAEKPCIRLLLFFDLVLIVVAATGAFISRAGGCRVVRVFALWEVAAG